MFGHSRLNNKEKTISGRKTTRALRFLVRWVFLVCFAWLPARAQDPQFLPEIDAHLKLNNSVRTYLQAKDDRDGGKPDQLSIGPSLQFYLKPMLRLTKITSFDLDDSKARPLVLETGYRYITSPSTGSFNRMETIATFNFPLKSGFLLRDRNRADLDWTNSGFSWRYRNKLTIERTFAIHSYHLIPYVAVEPFYESQYQKWATTDLYAGCLFPVGKRVEFDVYYQHENNTGKSPNSQQNYIGLALYLFFSAPRK